MNKRIKCGHYLLKKDLITAMQLIAARIYQIRNNQRAGALAQERKRMASMNDEAVVDIKWPDC